MNAVVHFGKYRGQLFENVPHDYYKYLLSVVPSPASLPWHHKARHLMDVYETIHKLPSTNPNLQLATQVQNAIATAPISELQDLLGQVHKNKPSNWRILVAQLYQAIDRERDRIVKSMEVKLSDLEWMNNVLKATGHPNENSLADARHALKTKVHINIFDLEVGEYDKAFKNYDEFVADTMKHQRFFNLNKAKDDSLLKLFLREVQNVHKHIR